MGESSVVLSAARRVAGSLSSEERGVKGEAPLKGRATIRWQEVPIIAATVACVLGLALSIIWKYNAYAVIFGIGTVGSIYTFYQARNSFIHQATNKRQAQIVDKQAGQLKELKDAVSQHEENNRAQRTITTRLAEFQRGAKEDLENFLRSLSKELGLLKEGTSEANQLAAALQAVVDTLPEKLNLKKLSELQKQQSEATGRLEALKDQSQVQLTFMDELRVNFLETFMQILQAAREEVKKIAPDKSRQVEAAFTQYEKRVESMKLPAPPKVDVRA